MKVRLGLEDEWDDEYYEDEYEAEAVDHHDEEASRRRGVGAESPYGSAAHPNAVRRVDRGYDEERQRSGAPLRSVPTGPAAVTQMNPQVKMHIAHPKSFDDAQSIADKFKQGTPVILNLTTSSPDVAKRLIDFSTGLTYGLDGGLQKVSDRTFMLTPHNVEVSDAERRRFEKSRMFPAPE